MNIFYLSPDPVEAAQMACDEHVQKMTLELAQMLCTAHRILDGEKTKVKRWRNATKTRAEGWYEYDWYLMNGDVIAADILHDKVYYAHNHVNHPSAAWVRKTNNTYNWAYCHFVALADEFVYRHGKRHESDIKLRELLATPPDNIEVGYYSAPPQCMFDEYKQPDTVEAYRAFYIGDKSRFATWKRGRDAPDWYKEGLILA